MYGIYYHTDTTHSTEVIYITKLHNYAVALCTKGRETKTILLSCVYKYRNDTYECKSVSYRV